MVRQGYGDVMATQLHRSQQQHDRAQFFQREGEVPTWNGLLFEAHYVYSPQLIFIGRYELDTDVATGQRAGSLNPSPSISET